MTTTYHCNTCGARAEGTVDELYRKGWRCKSIKKNNRLKRLCGCPMHAEIVEKGAGH